MSVNEKSALLEKTEEKLNHLKSMLEELELQFSLGKKELMDEVEKQKDSLNNLVMEIKTFIEKSDNQDIIHLKTMFEELQLRLALGKADTLDAIDEQKEKIALKLKEIETYLRNKNPGFEKGLDDLLEKFNLKSDRLNMIIDLARLKFSLGKADFEDRFADEKDIFIKKISDLKSNLNSNIEDINSSLNNIRNELVGLFNKIIKK